MVVDISSLERGATIQSDICVIGSGAAGITIAREFLGTSQQVIVLEAGGNLMEAPSQDPYRSAVVGLGHTGVNVGRARVLGGTTTLWAGQALPLFDIDFAHRDWVPYSGWPIDRKVLDPFYRRAEDVMQIPHSTNDGSTWPTSAKINLDPAAFSMFYSQFTSTPNFSQKYRADIAAAGNIRLITHANVTSLEPNAEASRLQEVRVRSIEGHSIVVQSRYFIVCCGGIESARLLLLSDSVEKQGIGNAHDVVGRYFQDHPGVAFPVKPMDGKRFSAAYDSGRRDGLRYAIKVVTSEAFQRAERTLHMGSEIYYPITDDDPITAAKDLLNILRRPALLGNLPSALGKVARRPHKVVGAAYRHFVQGIPPSVGGSNPHVGLGGEQQPNPQSRVTLGQETDVLGLRRTALDWRLTAEDTDSISKFAKRLAAEWSRLGVAKMDTENIELKGRESGKHGGYVDASHHMGTTRMGTDLKTSVVDARCRVHGYENLYIGSSSVFPTGGFSNPTLTVIALCLRIADELKQNLQ
jgi:choline dehydrogenase-like flavoprotein